MLLSALALAALLQAAPLVEIPPAPHVQSPPPPAAKMTRGAKQVEAWQTKSLETWRASRTFKPRPLPKRDFVVNPQTADCRSIAPELVGNPESLKAHPLSKMPKAHGERAVARMVDGCPVPVLIAQRAPGF
jgi:hypothetical protein